jgi:acetyltransferase
VIRLPTQIRGRSESPSIRTVDARDRDRLVVFVAHLSDESRRRHFMGAKKRLTPPELADIADVDHVAREAVVAVERSSIVGLARYVARSPSDSSADFAVTVTDAWQRRGLGRALSLELIGRACEHGIDRLHATTLWDNHPSKALLRRLGFRVCGANHGVLELCAALDELALATGRCAG